VIEVLAQVDRSQGQDTSKGNWYGTRRYYVTRGTDSCRINSRLLADLGPTNTGDPRALESFIRFGAQRYPARTSRPATRSPMGRSSAVIARTRTFYRRVTFKPERSLSASCARGSTSTTIAGSTSPWVEGLRPGGSRS
jgi:hypothetical protein